MTDFSVAFRVINERNCPFYGDNDWFVLTDQSVHVLSGQPSCLILVRELTNLLFTLTAGEEVDQAELESKVFNCGGCTGLIKFQIDDLPDDISSLSYESEQSKRAPGKDTVQGKQKNSTVMLSGSLDDISPSELLQFFHMHQKTGKLLLDIPSGTVRVAFREGAIIGARYGEKEDKDAIFAILGEKNGMFRFVAGIPESLMEMEVLGDFMMIIMEGLRRLDESQPEDG